MRVTFTRLADHQWGDVLIERDDRVVYRMHAGPVTAHIPHDLVHLTVEDALDMADGVWGAIAGGVVWNSMTHVSGRRAPHAAERSAALKRTYRDAVQHAELLGGFAEAAAERPDAELPRLAREWFGGRPVDLAALGRAVAALRAAEAEWAAVPVGGTLVRNWPARRRVEPVALPRHRERGRRTA